MPTEKIDTGEYAGEYAPDIGDPHQIRYRQFDPSECSKYSYMTVTLIRDENAKEFRVIDPKNPNNPEPKLTHVFNPKPLRESDPSGLGVILPPPPKYKEPREWANKIRTVVCYRRIKDDEGKIIEDIGWDVQSVREDKTPENLESIKKILTEFDIE
jgi:hypothetical protein